jgi:Lar family restriction alleviation protein
MNNELKPCPFCGGEAIIKATVKSCGFTIWCACKCGAQTEGFCPDTNKEDDTMENIEKCKKRAIEAWNRRANDEKTYLCG